MKLKNFVAKDMPSAMKMIREELGPNAVILATQPERGRKAIRVTAAVEAEEERTQFQDIRATVDLAHKRTHKREFQAELSEILEYHRTPKHVMDAFLRTAERLDLDALLTMQKLSNDASKTHIQTKALTLILEKMFDFSELPLHESGKRICLIGPVGAGKTLATAKCATEIRMSKRLVSVITLDHKRAGGMEQLAAYTDILEVPLYTASSRSELQDICKTIPLNHITLIDTPGSNPNDLREIEATSHMLDTANIEPVLVLPAGLDSYECEDMAKAFAEPALKRLLVTRLDAASRFGNILAAAHASQLAFCNSSQSPKVVDSCNPLSAAQLAQFLLQHLTNKK